MSTKPQKDQYSTRQEYSWANKQWKRSHGGSLLGTLAIAVFFGLITGSQVLLWLLVAFAIAVHLVARSRP